jgi:hypothetical protein
MATDKSLWRNEYNDALKEAVEFFWLTRKKQSKEGVAKKTADKGSRIAVVGGKQMDKFSELMFSITTDQGVPASCIFTRNNDLPGYFRPSKRWDFIVLSPSKQLAACIEFKSHVGSFGNNFNNRVEEALGSSVDIFTAYRESIFGNQPPPWLGYLMLVQRKEGKRGSTRPVRTNEPYFKVSDEFRNTSYLERYKVLCTRLMKERHYNSTCLMWTKERVETGMGANYGPVHDTLSFERFASSYIGYLLGRKGDLV